MFKMLNKVDNLVRLGRFSATKLLELCTCIFIDVYILFSSILTELVSCSLVFLLLKVPHKVYLVSLHFFIYTYTLKLDIVMTQEATNEPFRGRTKNVVSEQVRHKPTCTNTENS